jgi:hypothetical protein
MAAQILAFGLPSERTQLLWVYERLCSCARLLGSGVDARAALEKALELLPRENSATQLHFCALCSQLGE